MSNEQKIEIFAKLVSKEQLERLNKDYPENLEHNPDFWKKDATTSVKPGRKYTKVDVGTSGKFMIDEDDNIFGIKAYGVIHRGHYYGTLDTIDQYYWGEYYPQKK